MAAAKLDGKEKNWTEEESMTLMTLVRENREILEGKFSPSVTTERKRNTWRKITDILNSMYTNNVRDWMHVKKRYANIKQSAKKKRTAIINPPTGNQGPPVILTVEEETFLNDNSGAPSIEGIIGGMESGSTEEPIEVAEDIFDLFRQVELPAQPLMPPPTTPTLPKKEFKRKKGTDEKRETDEKRLTQLDITVQELKIKKLNLEIEILEFKKKKMLRTSES